MAWFHRYQFASVNHLHQSRAYPIIAYEIAGDDMHILAVKLKMSDSYFEWFDIGQISLYSSGGEFVTVPEQIHNKSRFDRLLASIGLRRL